MVGTSSSRGRLFDWKRWCGGPAVLAVLAVLAVAMIGAPAGAAKKTVSVPGAPTITSVKAQVRGVRVAFKAPASNGGLKITSYRVKCTSSDGGQTGTRIGAKSPIKVLSLSPAKSYRCSVRAHNRVGSGSPSAPSAPVVTLAP
jgi:hypothetical protein